MSNLFKRYIDRRVKLQEAVLSNHGPGVIMLCAAVEPSTGLFKQDKTFYYYTGLLEPGAVMLLYPDGKTELFVPNYAGVRSVWVGPEIVASDSRAQIWGVDTVSYQGIAERGYSILPFRAREQYVYLIEALKKSLGDKGVLHLVSAPNCYSPIYADQLAFLLGRELELDLPRLSTIASTVAKQRRSKDEYEVSCIRQAIAITNKAQQAARKALVPGAYEYEVRAEIEAEMIRSGSAHLAFSSIVATGKNATVLHYTELNGQCKNGDLAVVDIGAEHQQYASDITRTWSVGEVSDRQKELAGIVKSIQQEVARLARPGLMLRSVEDPGNSLDGIARELLAQHGYPNAMPHGIGHFMGLDVHDAGDVRDALAPGDVITIEPGIYLPEEGIGIRIEDNYLITPDGAECLSSDIRGEW